MAYSTALRRYEEQYDALKAELQTLGFIGQGSVHTRRITCGRATCRCHDDPDARHGPYHYWTRKARGKTVGLKLTEDELVLYRESLVSHSLRPRPARVAAGRGLVANGW